MDSNATASDEIEAAKTSLAAQIEDRDVLAAATSLANRPRGKKKMRIAARQRPDLSLDPGSD